MGILEIIGVLFLQFLMGYSIAVTSREVRKVWHETGESFAHSPLTKLLLYPVSAVDMISHKSKYNPVGAVLDDFVQKPRYVVLHLFLWEFRIVVNILLLLVSVIMSAIVVQIVSLVKGVISIFGTFTEKEKKEKPTLPKPSDNPPHSAF